MLKDLFASIEKVLKGAYHLKKTKIQGLEIVDTTLKSPEYAG